MLFRALTRVMFVHLEETGNIVFASPDQKDHLGYCHHFAPVVVAVVCCHLLDQMKHIFTRMVLRWTSVIRSYNFDADPEFNMATKVNNAI